MKVQDIYDKIAGHYQIRKYNYSKHEIVILYDNTAKEKINYDFIKNLTIKGFSAKDDTLRIDVE